MIHFVFIAVSFEIIPIRSSLSSFCIPFEADPYSNYGMDLGNIIINDDELRFLAIGDWGNIGCISDDCNVNLTLSLAETMGVYANNFDPAFLVSCGDHFYQNGLNSFNDSRWQTTFEDVFDYESLKDIYWYGTLGNHDWQPNRDNYNANKPNKTWDDGSNAQIYYTTNNNPFKRWCMPSYYYTFSVQFKSKHKKTGKTKPKIRFIAIDTILIQRCNENSDDAYCQGASIPNLNDFWIWFEEILNESNNNNELIVIYTHYPLVSNGNYGLKNEAIGGCRGGTATNEYFQNISDILIEYKVDLYIAGHEHNTNLFNGFEMNDIDNIDNYEMIELLVGSFGKTNSKICGNANDIKQKYVNSSIDWNMIYGTAESAFGAITINKTHLFVSLIDINGDILSSHSIKWNDKSCQITSKSCNADSDCCNDMKCKNGQCKKRKKGHKGMVNDDQSDQININQQSTSYKNMSAVIIGVIVGCSLLMLFVIIISIFCAYNHYKRKKKHQFDHVKVAECDDEHDDAMIVEEGVISVLEDININTNK